MQFPIFPEKHRKLARITLKIRKIFAALTPVCVLMLVLGGVLRSAELEILGFVAGFLFVSFYFATRSVQDVFLLAEIGEDGIRVVDKKGDVIRSAEYCDVRRMEVLDMEILTTSRYDTKTSFGGPLGGIRTKLIMVYINAAFCFEDLKLTNLGRAGHALYCYDEVFFHNHCIALEYHEEAWNLLSSRQCSAVYGGSEGVSRR